MDVEKKIHVDEELGGRRESTFADHRHGPQFDAGNEEIVTDDVNKLKRDLKTRHMQMIAIGGAIGAGLFVGSGGALSRGGPGALLICFMIIGINIHMVMQALAELAVMYPVNGAFYSYVVRFIDPSWGFAVGWDYAIQWLTILPFEITAAGITIEFWRDDLNVGIWVAVFLVVLSVIQIFGVKGYGEVEFILSLIKILACIGFIILGIIINCGGVPTDNRGYIGARYWHEPGAFRNGFKGFCSVFVTASFAYGGTELTGLAAAESSDPKKQIPKACKQVLWRIAFFYIVNLFILGLIVPSDSDILLGSSGANTKASPFVYAIQLAGIKALPSIFNVVITLAVISVANSATYASTRTIQALAMNGMAPKILAYVDKKGRPVPTVILQLIFGLLAFANLARSQGGVLFDWLLALSGLANFFVYGSICVAHIRFRSAWKAKGHTLEELPYKAQFGIWGSWIGVFLNCMCLAAQFYSALFPPSRAPPSAYSFFQAYLAAPLLVFLYVLWKAYSWIKIPSHRPLWVSIRDIDLYTGMRIDQVEKISGPNVSAEQRRESIQIIQEDRKKTPKDRVMGVVRALF